jgi:hypothetical protein
LLRQILAWLAGNSILKREVGTFCVIFLSRYSSRI